MTRYPIAALDIESELRLPNTSGQDCEKLHVNVCNRLKAIFRCPMRYDLQNLVACCCVLHTELRPNPKAHVLASPLM